MDHYLEIQLRPDPEIAANQLFAALYARLHRALVQLGSRDIGVSFPGYDLGRITLGTRLRLHGSAAALQRLSSSAWLAGMRDHAMVTPLAIAPADAACCRVMRVQAKSSPERLRRRAMRRHGIDAETATQRIPDAAAEHLKLPFVVIGSRSTAQPAFPLFIRQEVAQPQAVAGDFNSYGLSHGATVPWF
ncbi:MAG: type I-F CRISPR-associated endoribonuclease Cas6/Csy4 [Rhodanobacteraceae bacterium]|nr:type I-F CRISPR-associated endoribonuclease Cas6/Csy4 [Rhodanobacteraceae bacterium]